MYQPIEVTAARTVWIDSPSEDRLGFHNSSRVQIDRDPTGVTDWKEPGDAYRATLMSGMWPDDDELRMLVVGVVPGSPNGDAYLEQLVPPGTVVKWTKPKGNDAVDITKAYKAKAHQAAGMEILAKAVTIMPAWQGQTIRSIFVRSGTPHGKPQTVVTESQEKPERKMTFDMWRIQVDMKLVASGRPGTDELYTTAEGLANLRKDYDSGVSSSDFAHAYISVDI